MSSQHSPPLVVGFGSGALLARSSEPGRADRDPRGGDTALAAGPALPIARALRGSGGAGGAELVLLSREAPDAGPGVLESLRSHRLGIDLTAFTGGAGCARYLSAFGVDLLLTTDEAEAREAAASGSAAALVLARTAETSERELRIAVDLDEAWAGTPSDPRESGSEDAVLAPLARLLPRLRGAAEAAGASLRLAWVTTRGSSHQEASMRRLARVGLPVDEAFSLAGLPRENVLQAFGAQLLFEARTLPAPPDTKPEPRAAYTREGRPEADDSSGGLETPFSRLRGRR